MYPYNLVHEEALARAGPAGEEHVPAGPHRLQHVPGGLGQPTYGFNSAKIQDIKLSQPFGNLDKDFKKYVPTPTRGPNPWT